MEGKSTTREASHADSWYSGDRNQLNKELDDYLKKAQNPTRTDNVKAIISPHAGFAYSGPTAAWAYQYLQPKENLQVFLLGPCHHIYMKQCGISKLTKYQTPLGDINLDQKIIEELINTKEFSVTSQKDEQDEHSLEMQLPFIYQMLSDKNFTLVPIMVGSINAEKEEQYGKLLAPYFDDPNSLFIISSDFCHWGERFGYNPYDNQFGEIWQYIEVLDQTGGELVAKQDAKGFSEYIESTQNTICGRHPIGVLLNILKHSKSSSNLSTQFVKYDQSSKVKKSKDSSVSYAAFVTSMTSQN